MIKKMENGPTTYETPRKIVNGFVRISKMIPAINHLMKLYSLMEKSDVCVPM